MFVTRFPGGERRWQVGGAIAPAGTTLPIAWSRATNELFYFSAGSDPSTFQLMSVAVTSEPAVTLAAPVPLFAVDVASAEAGFDVAPDGKSLVIARDTGLASGHGAIRTRFTLVENWLSEFAATAR